MTDHLSGPAALAKALGDRTEEVRKLKEELAMTKEASEYLIDFDTKIMPGKIQAVRVRLDLVTISDMDHPSTTWTAIWMRGRNKQAIDLCDHPLYEELQRYVMANLKKGEK